MAAEIVVVVEDKNACILSDSAAEEPGRSKSADAAADNGEIVIFLDRKIFNRITSACARNRVRRFKSAGMLAAQTCQCGRIACRIGGDLCGRREAGRDRQSKAIEKVATGNLAHVGGGSVTRLRLLSQASA